MNKSLYLVSFAVGALAGSAASWFILKKKYEKIAQEEIDSVKELFSEKYVEQVVEEAEQESTDEKTTQLNAYNKIIERAGYASEEATIDFNNDLASENDLTVSVAVKGG